MHSRFAWFGWAALAVLGGPATASAMTYTWPGAFPCHLTLQVCLNSIAAGSTVEVATAGPIDEDVFLYQSTILRAAGGFTPAFAPGRHIHGGLVGPVFGPGPLNLTVEGLTLTDGEVALGSNGSGNASFVIRRMRVLTADPSVISYIRVTGNNTGSLSFDVTENEVVSRCDIVSTPALAVYIYGPTAAGRIQWNRITSAGGDSVAPGILTQLLDGALEVDIFANEVRGNFQSGAVVVREQSGTVSSPMTLRLVNNLVVGPGRLLGGDANGVGVFVGHAGIDLAAVNNTITATRGGFFLGRTTLDYFGPFTGTVRNNLIAFNDQGLYLNDGAGTGDGVDQRYNLVHGNALDSYSPGVGTLTSNPLLESIQHPRLSAGSPAIDAADTVYAQLLLGLNGLPQVDLDGMRRTIGGGSLGVDIGAYEFGDESLVASKTSVTGNAFTMVHPALNLRSTVRPVLTKNFSQNGIEDPFAIGTWYTGAFWAAFNQGIEIMPAGTAMNVFVPGVGGSFGASYAHVATGANTSGHVTTLDQTFLNSSSDAIVLATSNWDASGSGVYNNHHLAVGSFGSWFVLNQDFAAMPLGAAFNIYAQDPSPNAWVHTVAAHNRDVPPNRTRLDHRLLNGVPCAQVHITQRAGTLNDHPYDVYYSGGRWLIYNQDGGDMPLGSEFYALVNPRQVFECTDVIFEDGFQ